MGKKEIIDIIRQAGPEFEAHYGVVRLGMFGSVVRCQAGRRSDIDLLVSFYRDIDLFEFLDLREFIQKKLDHKVDLVMDSALKPAIDKRIRAEFEYV